MGQCTTVRPPLSNTPAFGSHARPGRRDFTPWIQGRRAPLEIHGPPAQGTSCPVIRRLFGGHRRAHCRVGRARTGGWKSVVHEITEGVAFKDSRVTVRAFAVPHARFEVCVFGYRIETLTGRSSSWRQPAQLEHRRTVSRLRRLDSECTRTPDLRRFPPYDKPITRTRIPPPPSSATLLRALGRSS